MGSERDGPLKCSHPSWCSSWMHRCLSGDGTSSQSGESFGMYTLLSLRLTPSNGIGSSSGSVSYGNSTLLIWQRPCSSLCSVLQRSRMCATSGCCGCTGPCMLVSIMHGLGIKVSRYSSMSSSLM